MTDELKALIESCRDHVMTPAELEAQEIDFAFGNVAMEYPDITRQMIADALPSISAHERMTVGQRLHAHDTLPLL